MDTSSFFKKIGKGSWLVLWRVILPFSAIRQSVKLAKKEVDRNKENLVYLRDLKNQAFKTLKSPENNPTENEANDTQQVEVGFEEAMRSRSEGALPVPQLYRLFLIKKRWALAAALFFAVISIVGVVGGFATAQYKNVILGAVSLFVTLPGFFLVALGAQFRMWQLSTRRLSKSEKGGFNDFICETPHWISMTLNPEISNQVGKHHDES
ncbi:hypothetical protein KCX70_22995 (plasmid) [Stutzerimonas stutzeri]|uniref:hypothetical protein n=1 Tax=Stutzerimonas stutzeri TaxID=316 RepID=UPI001BAF2FFB|nr:hypothetical protein [Stutzerimonas stutzeri]QUE78437.1 hypothetical protein KCX70_22995 [Stutzerimonas stutzeri]